MKFDGGSLKEGRGGGIWNPGCGQGFQLVAVNC